MGFRGVLLGWRSNPFASFESDAAVLCTGVRFLGLLILIYLIRVDIIGWIGYLGWNLDGL